jgi:UDP-hydrolysing UDP-N-acetyl-D-glucosamine 2-epimerase
MRKICVVVTARPSYSRVRTLLSSIKKHKGLELQLVVAGSALLDKYGSTINYIEQDGFEIAEKIYSVVEGEALNTMPKTTGLSLIELSTVFDNLKPDIVLTIADRYETIATAIAASYMNIPLAHLQGGEVTGSIDEKVRHAVTKLSDLHFVSNDTANQRLIKMGEEPRKIHNTGCPSIDLAAQVLKKPDNNFNPSNEYTWVPWGKKINISEDYIVVMQHPVTTEYNLALEQITKTLNAVNSCGYPVFWFWPNVDAGSDGTSKGIRVFREEKQDSNIVFIKNMKSIDFLNLLYFSKGIIGNSSVAIRECSFLGVPAINIGTRQQGREKGCNVVNVDHNEKDIKKCIDEHFNNNHFKSENIYGNGNSGELIAELLYSSDLTIQKMLTY